MIFSQRWRYVTRTDSSVFVGFCGCDSGRAARATGHTNSCLGDGTFPAPTSAAQATPVDVLTETDLANPRMHWTRSTPAGRAASGTGRSSACSSTSSVGGLPPEGD